MPQWNEQISELNKSAEKLRRLFYVALTRAKSYLHVLPPHRYYVHNHRKSDQHSYSQRTRFIPDELLPWFEPVTTGRATLEFPQSGGVSDVTTADFRKRIGRMWA